VTHGVRSRRLAATSTWAQRARHASGVRKFL